MKVNVESQQTSQQSSGGGEMKTHHLISIELTAPNVPGKFEYSFDLITPTQTHHVLVRGRAMKKTSGTPSLKKGVICIFTPPDSDRFLFSFFFLVLSQVKKQFK
jgi:hypothetical protein